MDPTAAANFQLRAGHTRPNRMRMFTGIVCNHRGAQSMSTHPMSHVGVDLEAYRVVMNLFVNCTEVPSCRFSSQLSKEYPPHC
jgi:hypothetical protein